jgi:AcrR family transcriptional regulator
LLSDEIKVVYFSSACKYYFNVTEMEITMPEPKQSRRVQQRALDTRDALLDTAIETFSRKGYDGASVRQIEELAGVNRGLVAYHFGDKAELWRLAAQRLFDGVRQALGEVPNDRSVDGTNALTRAIARAFIQHSAQQPALNRLMIQESMQPSWRVDYLVEKQIKPMMNSLQSEMPEVSETIWGSNDPHRYYAFVGAAAFVFSAAEECKRLFDTSPTDPDFIDEHAEFVLRLLLP